MKPGILLMILCTVFTSLGQMLLKAGSAKITSFVTLFNFNLILGFTSYGIGAILLIIALRKGELSILYPIVATSYVWVSLLSPYFFDDVMNVTKWIGVGVILVSVSILGFGDKNG